jgi:hypothetical protein
MVAVMWCAAMAWKRWWLERTNTLPLDLNGSPCISDFITSSICFLFWVGWGGNLKVLSRDFYPWTTLLYLCTRFAFSWILWM